MNCPRCKTELEKEIIRGINASIDADVCTNCGGRWFNTGGLSKVENIVEPTLIEIRRIPNQKEQLATLNCPACSKSQILAKAESTRDKHVILDYCPSCGGIWLDKGELEAIQKENWLSLITKFYRWLRSDRI